MADQDQELVTFYNGNEGWSFTSPIAPLLSNAVMSAMLTGEFREATTKRIQVPDFPRSVVERFVQDLANEAVPNHLEPNTPHIEHIQLARLAHRFDAQKLATAYLRILFDGRVLNATQHYELCRAVFELSAEDLYSLAAKQIATEHIIANDDDFLLKNLCDFYAKEDRNGRRYGISNIPKMKSWVSSIIQHKAHECFKVLLDFLTLGFHDLFACASDLTLPEDLISKLLKTAPFLKNTFLDQFNTTAIGVALREFPDDHNYWGYAFKQGFMEIIKFAPKPMLTCNDGDYVFGETAIHHGWINCLEHLLEQGWKPTTKALTMAMSGFQNSKLVKMLLKHVKPDCRVIQVSSIQTKCVTEDPERWACIDLIEKAALENALESDLYKIYSKSP